MPKLIRSCTMKPAIPETLNRGFPKLGVPFLGGPHNKDYSILGSILGSPYFGKLPNPLNTKSPTSKSQSGA